MFIDDVDYSHADGVYIFAYKKNSLIKFNGKKLHIYCTKEDLEFLDIMSCLVIDAFGLTESPEFQDGMKSSIMEYMGILDKSAFHNPEQEKLSKELEHDNESYVVFSIKRAAASKEELHGNAQAKDTFQNAAQPPRNDLEKRADVWKSRGLEKIDIRDESVWVSVKENVVIEDSGEELKLYGDYDLQAISLMVSHAKETWNNNCYVDGDDKFKTLVWRECYLQGVKLQNFEPEPKEKARIVSAIRRSHAGKGQGIGPQPIAA